MIPDGEAISRIEKAIWAEFEESKRKMLHEEGEFLRSSGARDAVYQLLKADALKPDVEEFVSEWIQRGGYGRLVIGTRSIVPPRGGNG